MIFSHFSPAMTRILRMVPWWTPVTRWMVLIEHPSTRSFMDLLRIGDFGIHAAERLVVRLGEGALARAALIAAQSVTMLAEFTARGPAIGTRHCGLAFRRHKRQNDSGLANPACGVSPRLSLAGGSSHQRGILLTCQRLSIRPAFPFSQLKSSVAFSLDISSFYQFIQFLKNLLSRAFLLVPPSEDVTTGRQGKPPNSAR